MLYVCISGANRGLGLEFCKQLLSVHNEIRILAGVRRPDKATELNQLMHDSGGRLTVLALDVSDTDSVRAFALKLKELLLGSKLELLINNAGLFEDDGGIGQAFNPEAFLKSFNVNAIGPMRLIAALGEHLLGSGAKVINISSLMGSLSDNASGGYYSYRASKAALNMCVRSFAIDRPEFITVAMHPGWVQTDMGGQHAPLTPKESVESLLRVISQLKPYDSGTFKNYDGSSLPW